MGNIGVRGFRTLIDSDGINDGRLVRLGQVVIERQTKETVADVPGYRPVAGSGAKPLAHFRNVQVQVVENADSRSTPQQNDRPQAESKSRPENFRRGQCTALIWARGYARRWSTNYEHSVPSGRSEGDSPPTISLLPGAST
jgi:hypothetical protein